MGELHPGQALVSLHRTASVIEVIVAVVYEVSVSGIGSALDGQSGTKSLSVH